MIGLIRAEWLKTTTTRMWWILLLVAVGYTLLNVGALVLASGTSGLGPLTDPILMQQLWSTLGSAYVIALVLGILAVTSEYRHMTITDSFLAEPGRIRFLGAKGLVQAFVGLIVALVCALIGTAVALALLPLKEHAAIDGGLILQVSLAAMLTFALSAVLGVSVGALLKNQVAALVLALVWILLAESLIVAFLPEFGKWLPGGATQSVLQAPTMSGGQLLEPWLGAVVLLGYTLVIGGVAAATTLRRDIT